ncbi:hypothetical protein GGR53DRAFT_468075 [Hypoxylon sp. FL1150]|nr:hypothetical protein GGR53DRAFT_468075 [Hypoxylon sp. FL1150]
MSNDEKRRARATSPQDHDFHMDKPLWESSQDPALPCELKQPDMSEHTEDDSLVGSATIGGASPDKHQRIPFRWQPWIIEFSCILVSMVSLLAIIGVLRAYDQSSLPQLPFKITLNSYLAFFTTLTKAALIPPVAEALSQIKWNWFHVDRPLKDIQILDAASRGTVGSLLVLARKNYGVAAKLGALVIALGLFTSPITQQLIEYPSRMVPSPLEQATVPTIKQLRIPNSMIASPYSAIELAITAGLTSSIPIEPIIPNCPTSNCTFKPFDSLGLCVKTANITDLLNVTSTLDAGPDDLTVSPSSSFRNTTYIWNVTLPVKDCYMVTQSPFSFQACIQGSRRSLAFNDESNVMSASLFSVFYIFRAPYNVFGSGMRWTTLSDHFAVEILIHLCVQTFDVSVDRGTTTSNVTSSNSKAVPKSHQQSRPVSLDCAMNNYRQPSLCTYSQGENPEDMLFLPNPEKPQSDLDHDLYGVTYNVLFNLGQLMITTITGCFAWEPPDKVKYIGSQTYVNPLQTLFFGTEVVDANKLFETVKSVYSNVATSVTNRFRTLESINGSQNAFLINGTAWEPETYVSIRWAWITFLVVQVAFGTVCFCFTVWQSHHLGIPILKSSALAMVFALGEESRTPRGIESIEGVEERTSKIRVRLQNGELVRTDIQEE